MKRILTMIALAVLTVGLTDSCSKNIEERLDKTEASVADIKAAIGQYETLAGDVTSVIEALRAEVGTRPASEQKAIWDCISALQNQKGTFEAAIAALTDLVGDEAVIVQIDDAVAGLISEYKLDNLAADIRAIRDKLNEKSGIAALADQVEQLQKKAESIALILSTIGEYEDMIQSVRINPTCADGSVKVEDGIVSFTFTVTPAEALNGVTNLARCLKLYADKVEVLTKAGAFSEIPVTKAEIIDKAKGEVRVEADITKFLPEEKTEALSIALNVRTGVSNYTTDFVAAKTAVVSEIDLKDHITYEQPDLAFSYPYHPSWSDNTGKLRILRDKGLKELGLQAGKSKIIFHKTPETKGQIQFCDPDWTPLTTVSDWNGDLETLEYVLDEAAIKCVTGETKDDWSETAFILQGDGLEVTKIAVLP